MSQGHCYLRRLCRPFDGAINLANAAKATADEAGNATLWLDGGVQCNPVGAHPAVLKYRKSVGPPVYPYPFLDRPMKSSNSDTVDLMVNVVPLPLVSPNQRNVLFEVIDAARASRAAGYVVQASKLFVEQRRTYHVLRSLSPALPPVMNVCSSSCICGARPLAGHINENSSNPHSLLSLLGRTLLIYRCCHG